MNPRTLIIEPVLNGFVVQVGCQRVVFDTPARLGAEVTAYYTNPGSQEKSYIEKRVNNTIDGPQTAVCAPPQGRPILRGEPIRPEAVETCGQESAPQTERVYRHG